MMFAYGRVYHMPKDLAWNCTRRPCVTSDGSYLYVTIQWYTSGRLEYRSKRFYKIMQAPPCLWRAPIKQHRPIVSACRSVTLFEPVGPLLPPMHDRQDMNTVAVQLVDDDVGGIGRYNKLSGVCHSARMTKTGVIL